MPRAGYSGLAGRSRGFGDVHDAAQHAPRHRSDYANAHYNLGNALLQLHRVTEARQHFEATLRIDPQFQSAREMLERLQTAPLDP